MNFETIQKIKSAIEKFPGVNFYSILEGNKLLIENDNSKAIYEISYTETDNGIIFNTNESKQISEKVTKKSPIDAVNKNIERLHNSINGIFSEENLSKAINSLKETIRELPQVDNKIINEAIGATIQPEVKSVPQTKLTKMFEKQLNAYSEEVMEFSKTQKLFDNDDEIIGGEYVEHSEMIKAISQMSEMHEKFKEDALTFADTKKKIVELFEDEKIASEFLNKVDFTQNIKVGITKSLVSLKQINENINITDLAPKLVGILENTMVPVGGAVSPVVYNLASDNKFRPRFFRFKMGIFTHEDVKTMINEVNDAFSKFGEYNEEEMMFLSNCKMQLEYMYNSQQINDHLIVEMIQEFNKRFAKDAKAEYDDAEKRLAWQNRDQQKQGNIQGVA